MNDNTLQVIFAQDFLNDIETLGNSVIVSDYLLEDLRVDIENIDQIMDPSYLYPYGQSKPTIGLWDEDRKELKLNIPLPSRFGLFSYKVLDEENGNDPEIFEIENVGAHGEYNNDIGDLIRAIKFFYKDRESESNEDKVAFIVTGNIEVSAGQTYIHPIRCDQDKILITVEFPETTRANIQTSKIEKDTKFLESASIFRGVNIFNTYDNETIATRDSAYKYLYNITSQVDISKKDTAYVGCDGRGVCRRNIFRVYTDSSIYCSNLITSIIPKTRASLNLDGGKIKIFGTVKYLEYEAIDNEFVLVGSGVDSINGIPNSTLKLEQHMNGLADVSIVNVNDGEDNVVVIDDDVFNGGVSGGFYVSYGRYNGQDDPSVIVKSRIEFWNPIKQSEDYIESEGIKLTQETDVISQWEIINRSTQYTEIYGNVQRYVYLFPWEFGYRHTFTIRTTIPDIRVDRDFVIDLAELSSYFGISIEELNSEDSVVSYYEVSITSRTNNLDPDKWLPIVNGESSLIPVSVSLSGYDYSETFYLVQGPKLPPIELHNTNNNNLERIKLYADQNTFTCYPVAQETSESDNIGERNYWKILSYDPIFGFEEGFGKLNPNNVENLDHSLVLNLQRSSSSTPEQDLIVDYYLGSFTIGRIRESECDSNFNDLGWRGAIGLSTLNMQVVRHGVGGKISLVFSDIVLNRGINLYLIKVISNGPFACWMEKSDDYCFFDPETNQPTYNNYFYSSRSSGNDATPIYLALHNETTLEENPFEDNIIYFTVIPEEPDWGDGTSMPDCFNNDNPENLATCTVYRQKPAENLVYLNPRDKYVFIDSSEDYYIKYKSVETPVPEEITVLERYGNNNNSAYYNTPTQISIGSPNPIYNTQEGYEYHEQQIRTVTNSTNLYPISPYCEYKVHSYNYPDIFCPFYIFNKGLDPGIYRSSPAAGSNVVLLGPDSSLESDGVRYIEIRSRYEIPSEEFVKEFNIPDSFDIRVDSRILSEPDYKYQYSIRVRLTDGLDNTGGQRQLGVLSITSRIYSLINFTSSDVLPYIELNQSDIDSVVHPAEMIITVLQSSGDGSEPHEIIITGDRGAYIPNSGGTRSFRINSSVLIDNPSISDIVGCSISEVNAYGFNLSVPSLTRDYTPVAPSETDSYINYSQQNQISFNLLVNPVDSSNYRCYSESFTFMQSGLDSGLIFATPSSDKPRLYLGQYSHIERIGSGVTSLNILLGVFSIKNRISFWDRGTTRDITIETNNPNTYTIINEYCYYVDDSWIPNIVLRFPENNTGSSIDRVFTIKYNDSSGFPNKITIIARQEPGIIGDSIICSDNAYFLSSGDCIETDNYEDNLGFFTFDTNIDINSLSLRIPQQLYESYSFIDVGPSVYGGYRTYKAQIKLKPNLSNSTIGNQIFSFIRNGESIRNVYINQGFYCLDICYPGEIDLGIYNGQSMGSVENPIEVPSRNNTEIGDRKIFKLLLKRSEPIPSSGDFTDETIDFSDLPFPAIDVYYWTIIDPSNYLSRYESIDRYLNNYSTTLIQSDTSINPVYFPFLENIYTVYSTYYTKEILIKINLSIRIGYPYDDPLYTYKKETLHSYTMYLRKINEAL